VKPYGIGGVTTLWPVDVATSDPERDAGFDVKVG